MGRIQVPAPVGAGDYSEPTDEFGRNCLVARRLVERGVRFVQLYSGGGHLEDTWDAHESVEKNHGTHGAEVDQPIAALLTDLERRGRRDVTVEAVVEPTAPAVVPRDGELGEEVSRALEQMRTEHAECFILFYDQNLSVQEISQTLGVPDGTVKTWLHRARKSVAEHLRSRGYGED